MARRKSNGKGECISRRDFLGIATAGAAGLVLSVAGGGPLFASGRQEKKVMTPGQGPTVSIVKTRGGDAAGAVEEAMALLGGIEAVTAGKTRIMIKPNLVSNDPRATTKVGVVGSLARLMKRAGKDVSIGEGSAAAGGFNAKDGIVYQTKNVEMLNSMQQLVFDSLGYTELSRSMGIPLVNLHTGDMAELDVPGGLAYKKISLHRSLTQIDMLCSVPMMKTHTLAGVTLGMKNLIGLYPGSVYRTVRWQVHEHAAQAGSPGIAYEILDMVRVNKLGLVVIDGSVAMEGDGPSDGELVNMNVIIAGTNPLATDMVGAALMGFSPEEIPTFVWANKIGLTPLLPGQIEVRGEKIESVRRNFARPHVYGWNEIHNGWGQLEMR
jgi:uncharacterized protein (DUF362 family)